MIVLVHDNSNVVNVFDLDSGKDLKLNTTQIISALFELSEKYSETILIWCHESQKDNLDIGTISKEFYLKNMMMSYASDSYLPETIGLVEDSPFLNVNRNVKYPTWLMSSQVGAILGEQLLKFKNIISYNESFNYALNSIAKLGMSKGLLCYSNPKLLKDSSSCFVGNQASKRILFKFVKQHYKTRWVYLLLLGFIIYEKKLLLVPFLRSLLCSKRTYNSWLKIERLNNRFIEETDKSVDVIVPTIGRKQFLFDVLKDLSTQTLLPKRVIIIEQNQNKNSVSDLDYLNNQIWPFNIIHKFVNQTGACNARNLAMKEISSNYIFFADDDIRFEEQVLQRALETMSLNNITAITLSCLQSGEVETRKQSIQWSTFGSGCSIVKADVLSGIKFDIALEHGFGEDVDFGMQLRNQGVDVIYTPSIKLLHLKAAIGGFRTKFKQPWENTVQRQPKPSPTVMYNRLKNTTKHQLLGYKIVLFLKYYKNQRIKNPIVYFSNFKKQWNNSVHWAKQLKTQND